MKFTVALISVALAFFSLGAQAMPSPNPSLSLTNLEARGCSCHKISKDEWLCGGTTCQ
ncbi:hypothetical protein BDQ17DRAFT_1281550 [Cyathus striatus]|nr:hypothetical protein BDQ17DRAFT_1281550 [Cyathus striatus]